MSMIKIGELFIYACDNLDAEDTVGNILQDAGLLHNLVTAPIEQAICGYPREDFRKLLDIEVEIAR